MNKATFDPAKNLDLYFRFDREGSKVLNFYDADGDALDITGITFRIDGIPATLSSLANQLTITQAAIQPRRETLFWELVNVTSGKTWLCGTAYYTSGIAQETNQSENITITTDSEIINITISDSSGSGGTSQWRGAWDASGNTLPVDGGSGVGGALVAGDEFYLSPGGNFDGEDWPENTVAKYLGSDTWRLI